MSEDAMKSVRFNEEDVTYWLDLKIAQKQRIGILADNFQCHHTKRLGASGLLGFRWLHVIPMCHTRKPESQASRKILRRANWQDEPMRPRNLDAPGSSNSQKSEGKPGAISLALVHRADSRSQGVLQTETDQQGDRQKLISNLVRAFPSDPGKKNLRQELQESCDNEKTPFSE